MRILFVGDACSGKTTILRRLLNDGHRIVFEEGWQTIPTEVEKNKLQSNLWFARYFYERELPLIGQSYFIERCFHFQYPFTDAQLAFGKITVDEHKQVRQFLDQLAMGLPLPNFSLIFHFICANRLIDARLRTRGRGEHTGQYEYWDSLRRLTESYFRTKGDYRQIDTSEIDEEELFQLVIRDLSSLASVNAN